MNTNEIKYVNELIDNKIDGKIPNIAIKKAIRKNKTDIYLDDIKLNKTYHTITPCINEAGEGTLIILNNVLYFYMEHQQYFVELQQTLTKLSEMVLQMQSSLGVVPSGGGAVVVDPTLVQKCAEVSTSIQGLLVKLP